MQVKGPLQVRQFDGQMVHLSPVEVVTLLKVALQVVQVVGLVHTLQFDKQGLHVPSLRVYHPTGQEQVPEPRTRLVGQAVHVVASEQVRHFGEHFK